MKILSFQFILDLDTYRAGVYRNSGVYIERCGGGGTKIRDRWYVGDEGIKGHGELDR